MKILYTCTYSAGISGVWNRVFNVAQEMIRKGHEVYVFSSNLEPGTEKKVSDYEVFKGIKCYRFPVTSIGSKNALNFKISAEAMRNKLKEIMPNVADCQTYRHSEGEIVSEECAKLGIPCFLTTHAPFVDVKVRGIFLSAAAFAYDLLFGREILRRFDKIIAITMWEYPFLRQLGIKDEKIAYIPNGIPSEFFKEDRKIGKKIRKILFFGRIAPVKDIETLIRAWNLIDKDKSIILEIIGPEEADYRQKLNGLIMDLGVKNIVFKPAVYDLGKKIKIYSGAEIFVLPSKREGMPQSLIEAMACGDIVVASDITANKELVEEGKNGFLFNQGDEISLGEKLKFVINNYAKLGKIAKSAKECALKFKWKDIANKLEKLYNKS